MKIIIGLGNPGNKYLRTFHNMGFMVCEAAAQKLDIKFKIKDCKSNIAQTYIKGERVVIATPVTFMNLSGEAITLLMGKYKAKIQDIVVIYDDIDIEAGTLRIRKGGSGGTHNGMRDIIAKLGRDDFTRIRVGIGRPPERMPLDKYVLSDIPNAMREMMFNTIMRAADAVVDLVNGSHSDETLDAIMQKYNG